MYNNEKMYNHHQDYPNHSDGNFYNSLEFGYLSFLPLPDYYRNRY